MASTITAQKAIQAPTMQPTDAQSPMIQQQPVQTSAQPTQIIQIPATPGPSVPANIQAPQGNVKYIKLPTGVTKGTYNLRSTSLNAKTPTTNTAIPVSVARGKTTHRMFNSNKNQLLLVCQVLPKLLPLQQW